MEDRWNIVLEQLKLQMTTATFGTMLAATTASEPANGELVIHAPTDLAKDWLEKHPQFNATIARAVASVYGQPLTLRVVNGDGSDSGEPETEPEAENIIDNRVTCFSNDTSLHGSGIETGADWMGQIDFDAAWRKLGYSIVSHYISHFWLPYLGPGFSFWKRLEADHRIPTSRRDIREVSNRWTPPLRYRYRQLARMIGKDHPRAIKGGEVECWESARGRRDSDPLLACCGNPDIQPVKVTHDQNSCARCLHWQTGLLEILFREGLVAIEEKQGQKWANRLDIQVWRLFPILTPHQVGLLNDDLQIEHERWLEGRSDRPHLGELAGLTLAEWEQIPVKSWVPHLPGYQEYRQLHSDFNPARSFLAAAVAKKAGDFF